MAVSQSEVFRFFTLRAPNKIIPSASNGFVSINPALLAAAGTYLNDMVNANATADPPAQQYAAMIALTETYQAGPDYYSSPEQISTDYNDYGIQAFYDWLIVNGEGTSAVDIETNANTLLGITYTDFLTHEDTNDLQQKVWENLVVHMIMSSVSVREYLQMTLRVSNLLTLLRDTPALFGTQEVRRKLIFSKVVLPKEIFPLPKPVVEIALPPSPTDGVKQARENLADEWHKYHNAIEDVRKKYACRIDKLKATRGTVTTKEINPCGTPGDFSSKDFSDDFSGSDTSIPLNLDMLDKSSLTPETITTVNEVWCQEIESIIVKDVVERLQEKLDTVSQNLAQTYEPFNRVTLIGGSLVEFNRDKTARDTAIATGGGGFPDCSKIKDIGVADLLRVDQKLLCYEPGEVAHIENILMGENKNRTTRRLNRREETFTRETIQESETEKDVQTTDRFEMHQESSNVVQNDSQFHVGVDVTANWGVAQIHSELGYAKNNSSTESNSKAVSFGKSVTERARQRVFERVREEKTVRIIEEFEEINQHGIENPVTSGQHVVGIYRWVDKIYKAQVRNYGLRKMFQFMVPEPALFHIHAMQANPIEDLTIKKPKDPREGVTIEKDGYTVTLPKLVSARDIDRNTYLLWAGLYGADVETPPLEFHSDTVAYPETEKGEKIRFANKIDFRVEPGYAATDFYVKINWDHMRSGECFRINLGNRHASWGMFDSGTNMTVQLDDSITASQEVQVSLNPSRPIGATWSGTLSPYVNSVPITFWFYNEKSSALAVNVVVNSKLLPKAEMNWKIKTYKAIIEAYEVKKAAYDSAVAQIKARAGIIQIRGNNPLRNREIEKTELKRGCIQMLRRKPWDITEFDAVTYTVNGAINPDKPWESYPEFDNCKAIEGGKEALFFELAFDWSQITYQFYPYFWANKERWTTLYTLEDTDPIFTGFLQAGQARVIVPVRRGFEDAVDHYVLTGEIWNGGEMPTLEDNEDLFVSIVDEMRKAEAIGDVGDPWEIRLPTNLVVLQADTIGIPDSGLPCYEEEEP